MLEIFFGLHITEWHNCRLNYIIVMSLYFFRHPNKQTNKYTDLQINKFSKHTINEKVM